MVQAPDAATVVGAVDVDMAAIEDLAQGRYREGVSENMPRDFVTMYHPDGTTSIVQLPPLPADGLPQGKAMQERQQKILHYTMNKKMGGKRWWFASPPDGWTPHPLPYRCPVENCTRAGGLRDLLNLWRHIQNKHPEETELYAGVLNAIKKKLDNAIPADLQALLEIDEEPISEQELETMRNELTAEPAVAPEQFRPEYHCPDCEWNPKVEAKQPRQALIMHRRHNHKED